MVTGLPEAPLTLEQVTSLEDSVESINLSTPMFGYGNNYEEKIVGVLIDVNGVGHALAYTDGEWQSIASVDSGGNIKEFTGILDELSEHLYQYYDPDNLASLADMTGQFSAENLLLTFPNDPIPADIAMDYFSALPNRSFFPMIAIPPGDIISGILCSFDADAQVEYTVVGYTNMNGWEIINHGSLDNIEPEKASENVDFDAVLEWAETHYEKDEFFIVENGGKFAEDTTML